MSANVGLVRRAAAERLDQAGDERRLAGTEIADQRDRIPALHSARELGAGSAGRRLSREQHGLVSSHLSAVCAIECTMSSNSS